MYNEILNINYHRRRLLLLALNKYFGRADQAKVLGVSTETVCNMMKEFEVENIKGFYVSNKKIKIDAVV